jgi:hypothetical protein
MLTKSAADKPIKHFLRCVCFPELTAIKKGKA